MTFARPVQEIIRARSSWRSYTREPLSPADRDQLLAAITASPAPPFGTPVRFAVLELRELAPEELRRLGTYGFIKGAHTFVAGAVEDGPGALEDYGWLFERLLLRATELGLATCWLGGTFDHSAFGQQLHTTAAEQVPAVSPVGYPTDGRAARDRLIRLFAGSRSRKPWEALFFDGAAGVALTQAAAGEHAEALEMVRLAPSASNKQPWRIIKAGSRLHLYLERDPRYAARWRALGKADLQRLDAGIAMCHLELTARAAGARARWHRDAAPDLGTPPGWEYAATWK